MAATVRNLVSMLKASRQREEWEWKRRAGHTRRKKNVALALEFMRRFSQDAAAPVSEGKVKDSAIGA